MSTSSNPVLPAKLAGAPLNQGSRLVIVEDAVDGPVVVRWSAGRATRWRCRVHGPMRRADCAHTFAAGLLLDEDMFRLTRTHDLDPEATHERTTAHA